MPQKRAQINQLFKNVEDNHLDVDTLNARSSDQRYDLVLCAEVLEYFSAQNVLNHLKLLKTLLNQSGKLLISVQIEIGLAGLAKNLVRAAIRQTLGGTSSRDSCNAFLDKPIYRGEHHVHSHIGFSYKKLEYLFVESGFSIDANYFSPFPYLGSIANSQVFFECSIG